MDGFVKYEMGLLRSSSFGRKRVALSNSFMSFVSNGKNDFVPTTPFKRLRLETDSIFGTEKSVIEDLPQEILVRILCGVDHDDLRNLFFVSKAIREATLIARQSHFAYSTPRKTVGFRDDYEDVEVPNAPKVSRYGKSDGRNEDVQVNQMIRGLNRTEARAQAVNEALQEICEISEELVESNEWLD